MKKISYSLVLIAIALLSIYLIGTIGCRGLFEKKYSEQQATQNFLKNEKDFEILVNYFKTKIPNDKEVMISFGLGKKNTIDLWVEPLTTDPKYPIIGGSNLKIGSSELDAILSEIGWNEETVIILRDKLSKINCASIMNKNPPNRDIVINFSGIQNYFYFIFDPPISDTLHEKPISNTGFGTKVFISYRADLL